MTKQEALDYRRHCPYDAMGHFSELVDEKEHDCFEQRQEMKKSSLQMKGISLFNR